MESEVNEHQSIGLLQFKAIKAPGDPHNTDKIMGGWMDFVVPSQYADLSSCCSDAEVQLRICELLSP